MMGLFSCFGALERGDEQQSRTHAVSSAIPNDGMGSASKGISTDTVVMSDISRQTVPAVHVSLPPVVTKQLSTGGQPSADSQADAEEFVSCAGSFTSACSNSSWYVELHCLSRTESSPQASTPQRLLSVAKRLAHPTLSDGGKSRVANGSATSAQLSNGLSSSLPDVADNPQNAPKSAAWSDGGPHVERLHVTWEAYKQTGHPCQTLQEINSYCQLEDIQHVDLENLVSSAPEGEEAIDLMRLLKSAKHIQTAEKEVMNDTGWQVIQNDTLQLYYQHAPNTTVYNFKGRCTLECPIEHLVALTREFDIMKTWNHHVLESAIIKEYSVAEMLVCAVLWMPWPLPHINLVVEAVGCDCLRTSGGYLVEHHTPSHAEDPKLLEGIPLAKPGNFRFKVMPGSCVFLEPLPPLTPGGPPRTRGTLEARADPGIRVPDMIITFILKVMGPFMYSLVVKMIKKEFKDPTRPIPSRIPMRPDFYGMVRDRAAAYLARQSITGSAAGAAPGRAASV